MERNWCDCNARLEDLASRFKSRGLKSLAVNLIQCTSAYGNIPLVIPIDSILLATLPPGLSELIIFHPRNTLTGLALYRGGHIEFKAPHEPVKSCDLITIMGQSWSQAVGARDDLCNLLSSHWDES
jgi:hypothetical protein